MALFSARACVNNTFIEHKLHINYTRAFDLGPFENIPRSKWQV